MCFFCTFMQKMCSSKWHCLCLFWLNFYKFVCRKSHLESDTVCVGLTGFFYKFLCRKLCRKSVIEIDIVCVSYKWIFISFYAENLGLKLTLFVFSSNEFLHVLCGKLCRRYVFQIGTVCVNFKWVFLHVLMHKICSCKWDGLCAFLIKFCFLIILKCWSDLS